MFNNMKVINPNEVLSTRYHRLLRLLMKGLGIWPYEKYWINCILRGLITLSMISIFIPVVTVIFHAWGTDTFIVAQNFIAGVYLLVIYIGYLSFIYHVPKLQYVIEGLLEGFKKDVGKEEMAVFEFYGSKQQVITEALTLFIYIAASTFVIVPVYLGRIMDLIEPLNEPRPKRLCVHFNYIFFDEQQYIYAILAHNCFLCMITIGIITFAETSYFVTTVHVISLFDVAKLHLKKASYLKSEFAEEKLEASNSLDDEVHKTVLRSIFVQQKAYEYFDVLQEIYSVKLFVEISNACTCLGLITVLIMQNLDNVEILLQGIVAYFTYLITIFFFNLVGQLVIDSSSRFFDAVYFCKWYNFPLKTQRLINLMLLRARRPCAYKSIILMVKLTNFGLMLRISASYFTFFLSTQNK